MIAPETRANILIEALPCQCRHLRYLDVVNQRFIVSRFPHHTADMMSETVPAFLRRAVCSTPAIRAGISAG